MSDSPNIPKRKQLQEKRQRNMRASNRKKKVQVRVGKSLQLSDSLDRFAFVDHGNEYVAEIEPKEMTSILNAISLFNSKNSNSMDLVLKIWSPPSTFPGKLCPRCKGIGYIKS